MLFKGHISNWPDCFLLDIDLESLYCCGCGF